MADQLQQGDLAGIQLGEFLLLGLLGTGGMAEVYRARDVTLGREVAVKVLAPRLSTDPGYIERFRTEARRVAALSHPHIVPVYTAGETGNLLYLVMPLLRHSLRDEMREGQPFPFSEATLLVTQIAEGLEAAHALGLVHRDVKPENILLGDAGQALLTDFGIARPAMTERRGTTTLSGTGLPVGTPEYMAPEQLRGEPIDARVDVYALGVVLYELLTGWLPFDGSSPYDVAARVMTHQMEMPSARNPSIPPELERVVLTAMAHNAGDRYPTVGDFAADLRRAINQQGQAVLGATLGATLGAPVVQHLTGQRPVAIAAPRDGATTAPPAVAAPWAVLSTEPGGVDLALGDAGWVARPLFSPPARRLRRPLLLGVLAVVLSVGGVLAVIQAGQVAGTGRSTGTERLSGGGRSGSATGTTPGPKNPMDVPTATGTAMPTEAPAPTATPQPTVAPVTSPLSMSPTPFVLNGIKSCTGAQTVTNTSGADVGWKWNGPSVPGFSFAVDGGPKRAWPDAYTMIAPGASSTLIGTTACGPATKTYLVTAVDTLGNQYTFYLSAGG